MTLWKGAVEVERLGGRKGDWGGALRRKGVRGVEGIPYGLADSYKEERVMGHSLVQSWILHRIDTFVKLASFSFASPVQSLLNRACRSSVLGRFCGLSVGSVSQLVCDQSALPPTSDSAYWFILSIAAA